MKKVSIYSTPSCHFCRLTKEFFKENNIQYDEFDVLGNLEKRKEMVEKTGQMGVPVITIDGEVVIGFNKPRLSELLGVS